MSKKPKQKPKVTRTGVHGNTPRPWMPREQVIESIPIKQTEYLWGILIFLGVLGCYFHLIPPSVTFSDSGDFITCAYTLGIAHPTGYPTWTMLGYMFTKLPLSNIGMRVTMVACISGALSVMLIYFCLLKLTRRVVISIAAAGVFAFSYTHFRVSQIADVYSLYVFFAALVVLILLVFRQSRKPLHLYLGAFVYGFSFTNHLLIITLFPAICYLIWTVDKKALFSARSMGMMTLCFFIGLLPYIYLPIRGFQHPLIDWGEPTTITSFLRLITGGIYKDSMFKEASSPAQLWETWGYHLYLLGKQFTFWLSPLILLGLWKLYRTSLRLLIFFCLIFFCNTLYALGLQKVIQGLIDHESYHLPAIMVMSILLGYGILAVYDWAKQVSGIRYAAKKVVYCFALLPIIPLTSYYHQADESRYFFAHDYGMNLLRHLPKKAMVFNQVDYNVFPLWYLQYVENVRLDVPVFSVLFLTRPWYVERLLKLYPDVALTCKPTEPYGQIFSNIINNNAHDYSIYFTHDFATQRDANAPMPQEAVRDGILYSLQGKSTEKELTYNYRGVFDSNIYKEVWANEVIGVYGYSYAWLGQEALQGSNFPKAINYLKKAMEFDKNNVSYYPNLALAYNSQKKHTEALAILKQGLKTHADKVELWYNLAMTYYYMQKYDEAISNLQQALSINPNDASSYDLLGICYHFKGKKQQAIEAIQTSLRLNPSSQEAIMHLGMVQ
ncbi:DUF2723 domain-containing protein [bacterium]|nr:DUF2723 domain-containing protein [bacterium]MBU1753261.1 DUF2723 domain-containing protein [bacterium]